MKNKITKQAPKKALHKTDVIKSFYCANEKKWLDKCRTMYELCS